MSKTAFIVAAFSLAVAAPAFAASHQSSGFPSYVTDPPNQPSFTETAPAKANRDGSHLRGKLDEYATQTDCKKQFNLLAGREMTYCTVVKG